MSFRLAFLGLVVVAFVACSPGEPGAATPTGSGVRQEALSLHLALNDTELGVGDRVTFSLAFRNDSGAPAVIAPPLDGSWDGVREPLYSVELVDEQDRPVQHALGFSDPGRCGMVNPLTPEDLRTVPAHGAYALEEPLAWAAPFEVRPHARPGSFRLRVRYSTDKLPGVTPQRLVSNAVRVVIRGGDERLWACRNAQVDRARNHTYANVTPARLVRDGDGYLLVYHRTETRVTPQTTSSASDIFVRRLGARGDPASEPVRVVDGGAGWLGLVEALAVPDGLLVAFTVPEGEEVRRVAVAHVATAGSSVVAGEPVLLSQRPGRPFFLALARRDARAGIVWEEGGGKDTLLRFRLLDNQGKPLAEPVALGASRGTVSGRVLLEPSTDGYLVAWHHGGGDVRLQWLDGNGQSRGQARRLELHTTGLVAVAERPGRIELVYDDSSVDHRKPGDTMGLHVAILSPDGARVVEDRALSPLDQQTARFGAATWVGEHPARLFLENQRLLFANQPGGASRGAVLSETAGGMFGLSALPGSDQTLAAWADFRDDALKRCLPSDCVSEVYIAVLGADGAPVVGPARATQGAEPRPLALHREDWQRFCE